MAMGILITPELIKSYDPCEVGYQNFTAKYPNYNDTLVNLLRLEDIPYCDKIWLVCKVVDYKILQQWSVECAENVVDNYNEMRPSDNRVSECIRITKLYLQGLVTLDELSAARSAAESAAWSAEWSARSAAWSAVAAAESAAQSAEWSARSAAQSAEWSARSAAEKEQENINLSILIALLENA